MVNLIFVDRTYTGNYRAELFERDTEKTGDEQYKRLQRFYTRDSALLWSKVGKWEKAHEVHPQDIHISRGVHGMYATSDELSRLTKL